MLSHLNPQQKRGVIWTVVGVLGFIAFILVSFFHRFNQPRIMTTTEMKVNGAYMFETPRSFANFELLDQNGESFTAEDLEGKWSLVFFGFTYCPDICPTTMAFLNTLMQELEGTEVHEDTQVVLVSVDPARDTPEKLKQYVTYFNPEFRGVTGEFLDIHRFATALNTPFRKVPGEGENYLVDHSANVVLINPRGDYHGFFKAPLELAKMKVTYRSARYLWDY